MSRPRTEHLRLIRHKTQYMRARFVRRSIYSAKPLSLPLSFLSLSAGDHLRRRPRVLRSDYVGKFVVSGETDKPGVPTGCRGRPVETRGMQRGLGRAIAAAGLLFTVHVLKGEEGPGVRGLARRGSATADSLFPL